MSRLLRNRWPLSDWLISRPIIDVALHTNHVPRACSLHTPYHFPLIRLCTLGPEIQQTLCSTRRNVSSVWQLDDWLKTTGPTRFLRLASRYRVCGSSDRASSPPFTYTSTRIYFRRLQTVGSTGRIVDAPFSSFVPGGELREPRLSTYLTVPA